MKKFIHVFDKKIVSYYASNEPWVFGGEWVNGESIEVDASFDLKRVAISYDENNALVITQKPIPYQELRAAEYPKFEDYMDGLVKSKHRNSGIKNEGNAQMEKYFNDCLAVKAKYPKD